MPNWGARSPVAKSPGRYLLPTGPAVGTVVASPAGANAFGSWVQFSAAVSEDTDVVAIALLTGDVTNPTYVEVQIGFGAVAAEAALDTFHVAQNSSGTHWWIPVSPPIRIPSGARLAVRTADDEAGANNHLVTLHCIAEKNS